MKYDAEHALFRTGSVEHWSKCIIILLVAFGITASTLVHALEPPTKEQVAQYTKDGTLKQRIEQAKAIGNHLVAPELFERYRYKMDRISQQLKGKMPYEMDGGYAPPPAWAGLPTTGTVKVFALLIAFNDYPPVAADTAAVIESRLFGDGAAGYPYESLRNYYRRASYNKLEFQGNVLGWYTTAYNRSSVVETTAGRDTVIKEALNHYEAQGHDFAQYDNNGDGKIDYFLVFWTGPHGAWATFWWGYQTGFSDTTYMLDGKQLSKYSWQWETAQYPNGNFTPLVAIHETGHALGVPDYYDYDDAVGPKGGVGGLDMMAGNWGDHNCFTKFMLDWITPVIYSSGRHPVTLNSSGVSQDAVALWPYKSDQNSLFSEYFMVQNRYRDPAGNDTGYPNDGLLIWHVDSTLNESGTSFKYNNSNTDHKLLRLMEADGLEEIESNGGADAGDYYVAGDELTPYSQPSSSMYDGSASRIHVVDISAPAPTMTATVHYGLELNLDRFKNLYAVCRILGCNGPFRPWEKYINPADIYIRALRQGGSNEARLKGLRQKAVQMTTRMQYALTKEEVDAYEKNAADILGQLNKMKLK